MKKFLPSLFCLFLTACVPLQQTEIKGGKGYDFFGYYGGYGLLQIGPSNQKKKIHVISEDSYAVSPTGKRFSIHSEPAPNDLKPSQYHSEFPNYYVRDRITLIDAKGKTLAKISTNGEWHFHFEFSTAQGRDTRDFTARFWMFYYNPIIHGPPN